MHIVSVDDLSNDFIGGIFEKANWFKEHRSDHQMWVNGKLMITAFFEPSTRTRLSFESAMTYLGGCVIGTENAAEFSSFKKGASIYDEFKVISNYCDVIVGRFRNVGDAKIAADASVVPLINGGDGAGEHPTQALLDAYTIDEILGERDSITVTFVGDNEYSRTVNSLYRLLSRSDKVKFNFLKMPYTTLDPYTHIHHGYKANGDTIGHRIITGVDLVKVFGESDVVYVTRQQIERRAPVDIDSKYLMKPFVFGNFYANVMPEHGIIMHPLPRTVELPPEVDDNPRAHYFEQARNGLYIRMALLSELLSG